MIQDQWRLTKQQNLKIRLTHLPVHNNLRILANFQTPEPTIQSIAKFNILFQWLLIIVEITETTLEQDTTTLRMREASSPNPNSRIFMSHSQGAEITTILTRITLQSTQIDNMRSTIINIRSERDT